MQSLQEKFRDKGVHWLMVNSHVEGTNPYLTPEEAQIVFEQYKIKAQSMLMDQTGKVGKKYGAQKSQYMVIVDPDGRVAYKGAVDDQPDKNVFNLKTMRNYITETLDNLLNGRPLAVNNSPSYGCPIKYTKPKD